MNQGYVDERLFPSQFEYLAQSVFFSPVSTAVFIIACVYALSQKKQYHLMILALFANLLKSFATAGRFIILYCAVAFIITLSFFGGDLSESTRRRIKSLVWVLFLIIVAYTSVRSVDSDPRKNSIIKSAYMYIASPVALLDYHLERFDGIFLHGKMFVYGFLDFFDSCAKYLIRVDMNLCEEMIDIVKNCERFVRVYANNYFNAFVSIFYYLYVDFGVYSIVAGNIIYGIVSREVYEQSFKRDIQSVSILVFFVQMVIQTMVRWPFSMLTNLLCVVYIILLSRKSRVMKKRVVWLR